MACPVPGPLARPEGSTPRQARVPRPPVAGTTRWTVDWREILPRRPGPVTSFSPVTSAYSGFLSFSIYEIFEDVDSSGWAWPEYPAAKCPVRWVRDEVCSGATMDGDLGARCLLHSPAFTSSVSSLYLHPASSSCPGLQSAPPPPRDSLDPMLRP